MRTHLYRFKRGLAFHWGYSSLVTLDKSSAYSQLVGSALKKDLTRVASTADIRNTALKQVFLKPRLTLLANTEKKTFSGFDARLLELKSPRVLKRQRRAPAITLKALGGRAAAVPVSSTIISGVTNSSLGWGRKSSLAPFFLNGTSLKTFRKAQDSGLLRGAYSSPALFLSQLPLLDLAEAPALEGFTNESNYMLSLECQMSTITVSQTFFEFDGENPNAPLLTPPSLISDDAFNGATTAHLRWVTGVTALRTHLIQGLTASTHRSRLAQR
jgi:hypothetical protein